MNSYAQELGTFKHLFMLRLKLLWAEEANGATEENQDKAEATPQAEVEPAAEAMEA